MTRKSVLIIDDNDLLRLAYGTALRPLYDVLEADSAAAGMEAIITRRPDCIVLDNMMPGGTGFQMLSEMRDTLLEYPPVIFISARMDDQLRRNAIALGAAECYEKGDIRIGDFLATVERVMAADDRP